jgi:hypothetical protein
MVFELCPAREILILFNNTGISAECAILLEYSLYLRYHEWDTTLWVTV